MTGFLTPVLLASSSEYRKKQLSQLNIAFESAAPNCNETPLPGEHPRDLAMRLSRAKAQSMTAAHPGHIIIGSDQTAGVEDQTLGKPLSSEKAIEQLRLCRGQTATFYSGLCVLDTTQDKELTAVIETLVSFRHLTDSQIIAYIEKDKPLYCAGSFKCESLGISLFEKIESEDPSALIGLPLIRLTHFLMQLGVDVLTSR